MQLPNLKEPAQDLPTDNNGSLEGDTNELEHLLQEPASPLPPVHSWCIVKYDDELFVGQVLAHDENGTEMQVSTMTM